MNSPALLISVSMRPNFSRPSWTIRSAVAGSAMSPLTVTTAGSSDGGIEREFAMTAQPCLRYAATMPAPIPCEAPVTIATFWTSFIGDSLL